MILVAVESGAEHPLPASPRNSAGADTDTYLLSCSEFAAINQVKAQTVRKRFCLTGSYFGVRPKKLANNRLAWPSVQVVA